MTRIFVYEYLTGGGIDPDLAGAGSFADLSALVVEGRLMRDALVADLHALDDIDVTFAVSRFETVPVTVDPHRAHVKAAPGEAMTHFVSRPTASPLPPRWNRTWRSRVRAADGS